MLALALLLSAMVTIPSGSYQPLYGRPGEAAVRVASFRLDRDPVTRREYLAFVREHPEWRRSRVKGVFADRSGYLASWRGDLDAGDVALLDSPVTGVSWFAARAYCAAQGKRLPTVAEWEYVGAASARPRDAARDRAFIDHLIGLYSTRAARLRESVRSAEANAYGVRGMHDRAWEWVEDFNSVLVSDDSRAVGERSHELYCASAAIGAADPTNYPAFLRYAIRAGTGARSSLETLGFRCAA